MAPFACRGRGKCTIPRRDFSWGRLTVFSGVSPPAMGRESWAESAASTWGSGVPLQRLHFQGEALQVREVAVHTGKAHVCDVIEGLEALHDQLADHRAGHLRLSQRANLPFDIVHEPVNGLGRDGPLGAGGEDAVADLLAVELLTRRPSRFTTSWAAENGRSTVVKRRPQRAHSRRRLMPSLASRESVTRELSWSQ